MSVSVPSSSSSSSIYPAIYLTFPDEDNIYYFEDDNERTKYLKGLQSLLKDYDWKLYDYNPEEKSDKKTKIFQISKQEERSNDEENNNDKHEKNYKNIEFCAHLKYTNNKIKDLKVSIDKIEN